MRAAAKYNYVIARADSSVFRNYFRLDLPLFESHVACAVMKSGFAKIRGTFWRPGKECPSPGTGRRETDVVVPRNTTLLATLDRSDVTGNRIADSSCFRRGRRWSSRVRRTLLMLTGYWSASDSTVAMAAVAMAAATRPTADVFTARRTIVSSELR